MNMKARKWQTHINMWRERGEDSRRGQVKSGLAVTAKMASKILKDALQLAHKAGLTGYEVNDAKKHVAALEKNVAAFVRAS